MKLFLAESLKKGKEIRKKFDRDIQKHHLIESLYRKPNEECRKEKRVSGNCVAFFDVYPFSLIVYLLSLDYVPLLSLSNTTCISFSLGLVPLLFR